MSQIPLFVPESDWAPPKRLPTIPSGVVLAIDTETRDDGLSNGRGPGWVFGAGYVVGFSLAWNDQSVYIPLRHPESENWDVSEAVSWLQDAIDRAATVVFHNQPYDQGWLSTEGIKIHNRTDDTHAMAVMVDENRDSYGLDACCEWRGVPGKDEEKLREAAAAYGVDPKKDLWKLPARYVGPYAAQDALATLRLRQSLQATIEEEGLGPAYRLEIDLIPMVLEMRRRGIRVDESGAEKTADDLNRIRDGLLADLSRDLGVRRATMTEVMSPRYLEQWFQAENIEFPRTPKTKVGSFSGKWMEKHQHWLPQKITRIRKLDNLANKFIRNYLLQSLHVGRVHAEVHALRDDDAGTRSFRFSYSNPPLQQMPARDPELAPLCRGILLPERGSLWCSADYSQQEPRMGVHFAAVANQPGADEAVAYYLNDPNADFHQMVADMTRIPRKDAKIINLGMFYGMGVKKLAVSLGISVEAAQEILDQYNHRMPWLSNIFMFCERRAAQRGFIRMLDGCRAHFNLWEPAWGGEYGGGAFPQEEARLRWPDKRLRRAYTRDAFNRLVQGSSARQTKKAMLDCWREGIIPNLQMHDELDFSVDEPRTVARISDIMINAVQLRVPMAVDTQLGWTWGQASEEIKGTAPPSWDELMMHGPGVSNRDIIARR